MSLAQAQLSPAAPATRLPRLGFVGTGWIGRLRMQALLRESCAHCLALHDPSQEAAEEAACLQPGMQIHSSLDELLEEDLDGIVIATPSALHAEHCVRALKQGKAVFCQKPLARDRAETAHVLEAAREANRLLAVDFSYRHLAGMAQLRELIASGELGDIFATDLVFHNAYGPDKPWFYDVRASGGGCVMDLGIHLVDLVMWLLNRRDAHEITSTLFHQGRKLEPPFQQTEDYAEAQFSLGDTRNRLCCSWNLHAGQDAVIKAHLYGTRGGATLTNVDGSFFDFEVHRLQGTGRQTLASYPDDWGGRALSDWVRRLERDATYDPEVEHVIEVADVIDRIYCR